MRASASPPAVSVDQEASSVRRESLNNHNALVGETSLPQLSFYRQAPCPAGHHDEDPPRRRPRRRRQGPVPVLGGLPEPDQHAVLHRRPWAGYVPRRAADALQWQLRDHVSGARRRPPRRATPSAMRARFPIRSRLGSLLRAAHGSRWGLALWVARKSSPSALTAATAHAPRATSARDAYPWLAVGPTRDGAQDFYDNCDTTGLPPSMDTLATTCRSTVRPSSFLAV